MWHGRAKPGGDYHVLAGDNGGGGLVLTVLISHLVDRARPRPVRPEHLGWAPGIPIRYLDVDGITLRYVAVGEGPAIVLLHTLRTQLDMFQRVIPQLSTRFRVYAVDYPGHGYSDIPPADYSADFFIPVVGSFLDRIGVEDATVVGESIGATIALALAARHHPRVGRVVAVNPYDYGGGTGLRRGNGTANLLLGLAPIPIVGETVLRLRQPFVERRIFQGGVRHVSSWPRALLDELTLVGNRPGYQQAFLSLVRHWPSWEAIRREYPRIDRPVLLVYGEHDWSTEAEREANRRDIPGSRSLSLADTGHFVSLESPDRLAVAAAAFASSGGKQAAGVV